MPAQHQRDRGAGPQTDEDRCRRAARDPGHGIHDREAEDPVGSEADEALGELDRHEQRRDAQDDAHHAQRPRIGPFVEQAVGPAVDQAHATVSVASG